MKNLTLFLFLIILFSCGENTVKVDKIKEDNLFNGFYERIGTVQYVKGVAVDTVYYEDLDNSPRQVKAYYNGVTSWLSNNPIPKEALETGIKMPWQSGQGSYGTYEYTASENESEMIETNLIQPVRVKLTKALVTIDTVVIYSGDYDEKGFILNFKYDDKLWELKVHYVSKGISKSN